MQNAEIALSESGTDRDSSANIPASADQLLTTGPLVYFISPSRSRRVKIGFTTNLDQRLRDLQSANHVLLNILLTMPGDMGLEVRLHHRFRAHRLHNEWFSLRDEIKSFIVANGGVRLPPAGSYTRAREASEDDVRAMLIRTECAPATQAPAP